MELVFFNRYDSIIDFKVEGALLRFALLLGEKLWWRGILQQHLASPHSPDEWDDAYYIKMYKGFYENDEVGKPSAADTFYSNLKLIRKIKHKDKKGLVLERQAENYMKEVRNRVHGREHEILDQLKLRVLLPFVDQDVFEDVDKRVNYLESRDKEDPVISLLHQEFSSDSKYFFLPIVITDGTVLEDWQKQMPEQRCSLPLFELPPLQQMSFEKLDYTRNEMLPLLKPLESMVKQYADALHSCTNMNGVMPLLRKCMDPEYILQLRNQVGSLLYIQQAGQIVDKSLRFFLSMETMTCGLILNYYENQRVVPPYIASTVGERLGQEGRLDQFLPVFCMNLGTINPPKKNEG